MPGTRDRIGRPVSSDQRTALRLLFVCTGNTCRTPIAEALARREVRRRSLPVEIRSAGTFAARGQPASGGAMRTAGRHGLDLSEHRSEPVTEELLGWADQVYGMTASHVRVVDRLAGKETASLLTDLLPRGHPARGGPVSDPVGGSDAAYEEAFDLIEECVGHLVDRLDEGEVEMNRSEPQ